VETVLSAHNATNAQAAKTSIRLGGLDSADGIATTVFANYEVVDSGIAEDSTTAKTLELTFKHTVANANLSARALAVQLELL
jgi:hypothetical protein